MLSLPDSTQFLQNCDKKNTLNHKKFNVFFNVIFNVTLNNDLMFNVTLKLLILSHKIYTVGILLKFLNHEKKQRYFLTNVLF